LTTSTTSCVRVPRLVVDYFASSAHPGASARRAARCRLLRLRRASGCFGTSHGSLHRSSSTTSPRAGSASTTSPTLLVRVPRHIARLVTRLVVDYFTSRRLLVDYFAYAARPCASTRRAARCRLLRLRRASGCLDTSRGSLHHSSSTTSPTPRVRVPRHIAWLVTQLVVDYFASRRLIVDYYAYAVRPGASPRRAARHVARHRQLRLA
jgi:hypothetical protein